MAPHQSGLGSGQSCDDLVDLVLPLAVSLAGMAFSLWNMNVLVAARQARSAPSLHSAWFSWKHEAGKSRNCKFLSSCTPPGAKTNLVNPSPECLWNAGSRRHQARR